MRENKTLHYYMKWALMLTFMWICQFANAQDFVKGKVIDQAGEPVTGAYVRWKDTKIGASTDVDGNFSIPAHQGKLVISFLGYKTKEVSAQSGKQIEVKLEEDAQHLDEFVVIGYGLQKKSSITGSIETIKADDLLMMPTANLDNALTGQVAGLQVMASTGDPSTAKEADFISVVLTQHLCSLSMVCQDSVRPLLMVRLVFLTSTPMTSRASPY